MYANIYKLQNLVYNMLYSLRPIVNSNSTPGKVAKKVMGLTIPDRVAVFFEGCHFHIEKSGTCIVASSGANFKPTKQEIERYDFSDIIV